MEYKYIKELQIASVFQNSDKNSIKVHALLQNSDRKQPSINAYLGARYSRSSDTMTDIAQEILNSGVDASARLESIFQGYGHKSVGDMADLFLCIENIPMITAMRLFNMTSVVAGQERSTRFQNFKNPVYRKLTQTHGASHKLVKLYEEIIQKQMNDYQELLEPTRKALAQHFIVDEDDKRQKGALQARTFDTARYLLPLALNTSLGLVMSARNWSELISRLSGSIYSVDNELANLILTILSGNTELTKLGYIPEAEGLVRHAKANKSRKDSAKEIKEILQNHILNPKNKPIGLSPQDSLHISDSTNAINNIVKHYLLSINSRLEVKGIQPTQDELKRVGEVLFKYHNHHNQIGNMGQSGAILIEGYADHGVLKDLNRHRSMERYIPFWDESTDVRDELNTEYKQYYLCDYLNIDALQALKTQYQNRLDKTYKLIDNWIELAGQQLDDNVFQEFTRYLLPHAHATRYRFYGSLDDIQYTINLRTRPGGHIAYRKLTNQWLEKLAILNPIWEPMLQNINIADESNEEQFFDRS